jgi:hypothetical protein
MSSSRFHSARSWLGLAALTGAMLVVATAAAQPLPATTPLVVTSQSAVSTFERDLAISSPGTPVAPVHETFTETRGGTTSFLFVISHEDDGVLQHPDAPRLFAVARGGVLQLANVFEPQLDPDHIEYLSSVSVYASGQGIPNALTSFESRAHSESAYDLHFRIPGPEDVLILDGRAFFSASIGSFQLSLVDLTLGQTLWTFERSATDTDPRNFRQAFSVNSTHDYQLTARTDITAQASGNQAIVDPFELRVAGGQFTVTAVPEAQTWVLMVVGLAVLMYVAKFPAKGKPR